MFVLQLFLLFLPLLAEPQAAHKQSDGIEKEELTAYINNQNECEDSEQPLYFSQFEQFDFLGKGYPQAVVVAGTCMTGTAGPDVHAVYSRNENGEIQELKIEEVKLQHTVLFGNRNSEFRIQDGLLVQVFYDTSDREDPLVIKYKWDAARDQFTAVSVEAAKPFPTSYDCAKAEAAQDETAQAICYVKSLADLDLELAKLYKAHLAAANSDQRKKAVDEQRAWLAKRNACGIYKFWVECLTERYNARIAELRGQAGTKDRAKADTTK